MSIPPLSTDTRQPLVIENSETNVRIANSSDHGVAWRMMSPGGVAMQPKFGVLAPRESCELNITREKNEAERQIAHDRVGIEWIEAPAEKSKDEMCEDWFDDAKIIHRKNFSITDE
ncbi:hypothetical protein V3C99_009709 [Haemonchus contortus]